MRVPAPVIASFALTLAACAVPSPAVVARFEPTAGGHVFRGCQIALNWRAHTLVEECGPPLACYPAAHNPEMRCLVYDTAARSFAGSDLQAPPFYVVCMAHSSLGKARESVAPIPGFTAEDMGRYAVEAIYGVSTFPGARTTRTSTTARR
jgi:hypothetical protein